MFKDSIGIIVRIYNEIGVSVIDTGTVVTRDDKSYYVTKRDKPTNVYERANLSGIKVIGKL